MSGGAYEYLNGQITEWLDDQSFKGKEHLEQMIADCDAESEDFAPAASGLRMLLSAIRRRDADSITGDARRLHRSLSPVIHAIEWWQSNDWGRERAVEAVKRWTAQQRGADEKPEGNVVQLHAGERPVTTGELADRIEAIARAVRDGSALAVIFCSVDDTGHVLSGANWMPHPSRPSVPESAPAVGLCASVAGAAANTMAHDAWFAVSGKDAPSCEIRREGEDK